MFAHHGHRGKTERLAQSGIDVEISRAPERVAGDSRTCRHGAESLLTGGTECWVRAREQTGEQSTRCNGWRRERARSAHGAIGAVIRVEAAIVSCGQILPRSGVAR